MAGAAELAVVGCLTFFGNVAYAMTSFGNGVIFQTGWHCAQLAGLCDGSVVSATTSLSIFMTLTRTIQGVHLRKSYQPWIVAHMLPPTLLGLLAGVALIFRLPVVAAQRTMGCLFLSIMGFKYRRTLLGLARPGAVAAPPMPPLDRGNKRHRAAVVAAGFAGGIMSGMFGTPGPPVMVLLSFVAVDPLLWRASSAVVTAVMTYLQLYLYLGPGAQYDGAAWPSYATMIAAALAGLAAGNALADSVDQDFMQRAIAVFLTTGAAAMVAAGTDPAAQLLAVAAAAAVLALCACAARRRRDTARAGVELPAQDGGARAAADDGPAAVV